MSDLTDEERMDAINQVAHEMVDLHERAAALFDGNEDAIAEFIAVTAVTTAMNAGACPHCVDKYMAAGWAELCPDDDVSVH